MSIYNMSHLANVNEKEIFQVKKVDDFNRDKDILYVLTIDEFYGFNLYRYTSIFSNLINRHDLHLPATQMKKRNQEYELGLTDDYIDSIYEKARIDSQVQPGLGISETTKKLKI